MYAVIKTGGKQHKVAEGEILKVEKLKASEGEPVDITDVLLIEKRWRSYSWLSFY